MDTDTRTPVAPSPLLSRPGAVAAEGPDAGVAWHYGDPLREQRLLAAGQAVVDLSQRGVVRVAGPDRLTWLNSLTSQRLDSLAPRESTETLVLSPHGHVEHALHVVDDGEVTWLGVEPGAAPAVAAWLDRMRFMLRVEVEDATGAWATLAEARSDAAGLLGQGGPQQLAATWQDPWPTVADGSASYAAVDPADHPGRERPWREVLVPRDQIERAVGDRPLAGTWAAEALRVAAWRPRVGYETDHRTIPHEVDWLRTAVHLAKGCYRGQETVARVHNLGRPPRRLVMLHLDGSAHTLPEAGDDVLLGERRIGQVTTAARHYELGPIALALVKRSVPADATVLAGGLAAAQEVVVSP
jgi:folate-binding protein YgfZ